MELGVFFGGGRRRIDQVSLFLSALGANVQLLDAGGAIDVVGRFDTTLVALDALGRLGQGLVLTVSKGRQCMKLAILKVCSELSAKG